MMMRATATAVAEEAVIKKRALSLILAIILSAALCACGQKQVLPSETTPAPTPTVTPEFLWTTEYAKVDQVPFSLAPLCYCENGFYAYGFEKTGENIPEEVIEKARKEKQDVVNDGRYDVLEMRLCFVSLDGTVAVLDRFTEMPDAPNTGHWKNFDSVSNISSVARTVDGKIYTLEYTLSSGNTMPDAEADRIPGENYNQFATAWYMRIIREDGKILSKIDVKVSDGISLNGYSFLFEDGFFYAVSSVDSHNGVAKISEKGEIVSNFEFDGSISKLIKLGSGGIGALGCGQDGGKAVYAVDTQSGAYTKIAGIPDGSYTVYSGGCGYDFFYTSGVFFYGVANGRAEEIFNWTAVNVNSNTISSDIVMNDDNSCVFLTDGCSNVTVLKRIAYDKSAERKALVLATVNPTNALVNAVSEFNRTHYEVRIDIEDYSEYTNGETGLAALGRYAYTRHGGKLPDIMDIGTLPYASMASDGMLEDLYKYIDSDVQLKRSDFFQNVLVALEIDGRLCCTCAGFTIDTVLGLSETVGSGCGWDYDKYYNALASMGENTTGFDVYTTRESLLREMLAMDLDSFIDWDSRTCNFTDGRFEKLLEFINTFPEYYDNGSYSAQGDDSTDMRIRDGRQMLLRQKIYGFDDFMWAGYEFEDDVSYIGYPTLSGTGNMLEIVALDSNINLAMSADCSDKAAAWEFLRTFFTEEYQTKCSFFPSNVNVFNRKLYDAKELTPILSKKGEQLYDDDGQPRYYAVGTMYLSDYTPVPYYPISDEKADRLKELINTTTKVADYNEDIFRIVSSAVKGDNAAEVIQQQVTDYLSGTAVHQQDTP